MAFKIVYSYKANIDTFEAIEWYNTQITGLGKRFYLDVKKQFKILSKNPYFQIRYENVRCLPLEKFPYMVHFIIVEERKQVVILGVISTSRNSKVSEERDESSF